VETRGRGENNALREELREMYATIVVYWRTVWRTARFQKQKRKREEARLEWTSRSGRPKNRYYPPGRGRFKGGDQPKAKRKKSARREGKRGEAFLHSWKKGFGNRSGPKTGGNEIVRTEEKKSAREEGIYTGRDGGGGCKSKRS